jgi:hypothetical protein
LENFIDHGLLFYRTPFPSASRRKHPEAGKWDCLPKKIMQ